MDILIEVGIIVIIAAALLALTNNGNNWITSKVWI